MTNQADAARRIGAFLRFPELRDAAPFPHSNRAKDGQAQKTILCDVRDRLEAVYAPENEKRYAYRSRRESATDGPAEEPPSPRMPRMPCVRARPNREELERGQLKGCQNLTHEQSKIPLGLAVAPWQEFHLIQ